MYHTYRTHPVHTPYTPPGYTPREAYTPPTGTYREIYTIKKTP